MKKLLALILILALSLAGCSLSKVLMPYHDQPLCQKGAETGYCGSITAVYQKSLEEERRR